MFDRLFGNFGRDVADDRPQIRIQILDQIFPHRTGIERAALQPGCQFLGNLDPSAIVAGKFRCFEMMAGRVPFQDEVMLTASSARSRTGGYDGMARQDCLSVRPPALGKADGRTNSAFQEARQA